MKLVLIYGPPAVGKLTVATELAKITGFKLYHNHISVESVRPVFEFGTPSFWRLVGKFRREVLEEAAREGVNVIFTFVYAKGDDDEFIEDIVRRVESKGGTVCFVHLYCDRHELLRRVGLRSRKKFSKLITKSDLNNLLKGFNLTTEVPIAESLSIDVTTRAPGRSRGR